MLAEFDINPRTWKNPDKLQQVKLEAEPGSDKVKITAWYGADPQNEFFYTELADNQYNGIDLNFLIASNPLSEKFRTDYDDEGRETLFGTVRRNLVEEEKAMRAGLAPGKLARACALRRSFSYTSNLLHHDVASCFLLEPLTYVSASYSRSAALRIPRGIS